MDSKAQNKSRSFRKPKSKFPCIQYLISMDLTSLCLHVYRPSIVECDYFVLCLCVEAAVSDALKLAESELEERKNMRKERRSSVKVVTELAEAEQERRVMEQVCVSTVLSWGRELLL